jgi:hypothetical protein
MRLAENEVYVSGLFNRYRFERHCSTHRVHHSSEMGVPEDKWVGW